MKVTQLIQSQAMLIAGLALVLLFAGPVQAAPPPQGPGSFPLALQQNVGFDVASEERFQASDITGSQPWIWILCKFADDPSEPAALSYFQSLHASLNTYFQEASYNKANITGSNAVGWFTLPQNKAYYVYDMDGDGTDDIDSTRIAQDCTAVADSSVDFNGYKGINVMLNGQYSATIFGYTSWKILTLDGTTRTWPVVAIDNKGSYNMALTAHEMYHGFGLGHSAVRNPDGTVYSGSHWDPVGIGACGFGSCTPSHLPAPQKDELGWIDDAKTYTATLSTQTITLEALALPQTSNYLMARIPLDNDQHFYTVEARRRAGYDTKVPGPAVLIHEVNLNPGAFTNGHIGLIPVPGESDPGGNGAMWTVGTAPFVDSTLGITVTVVNATATGFQVQIEVQPVQTQTLYVKANATGANNGTSWTDAYTSLQSALAAANPIGRNQVEIWVAQGTYKPTAGSDRTAAFGLKDNVHIYGGFNGTESNRSQRNIAANPTFLNGDLLGNDNDNISYDEPTRSDNSYHVITDSVASAVLDGVIILGGNANDSASGGEKVDGGGMYSRGNPTLRNVTFRDNTASDDGGGMMNYGGDPILVNVTFLRNKVHSQGGGMAAYLGNPRLTQVLFSGNVAHYQGGGLYTAYSNATLINTTVSSNTAAYYSNAEGGGIYAYGNSSIPASVALVNSIFWGNTDKASSSLSAEQLAGNAYGTFSVSYSDVQGGYTGTDNINLDPLFVDADGLDNIPGTPDDNLRLQTGSPAIDSGSNSAVPADEADLDSDGDTTEQLPRDLGGCARFVAHSGSGPAVVDMGAYEAASYNYMAYLPMVVKRLQ